MVAAVLITLLKTEMMVVFSRALGCKAKREEPQDFHPVFWKCKGNKLWMLLFKSDVLLFLKVGETETRLECLLNNNKNSDFCAPLTSFDWNEVDPYLLGETDRMLYFGHGKDALLSLVWWSLPVTDCWLLYVHWLIWELTSGQMCVMETVIVSGWK